MTFTLVDQLGTDGSYGPTGLDTRVTDDCEGFTDADVGKSDCHSGSDERKKTGASSVHPLQSFELGFPLVQCALIFTPSTLTSHGHGRRF